MKKKLLVILITCTLLSSLLSLPINAGNEVSYIDAAAYTTQSGIEISSGKVMFSPGDTATYSFNAPTTGYYKINIVGSITNASIIVTVGDISYHAICSSEVITAGRFYMTQGANEITLSMPESSSNAVYSGIKVSSVDHNIGNAATIIEAEDYYTTNINESAYVDNQWSYSLDSNLGCISFCENWNSAVYRLYANDEGLYKIKFAATGMKKDDLYTVSTSGKTYENEYVLGDEIVFEHVELAAGLNELILASPYIFSGDGQTHFAFLYYMTVEYIAPATKIVNTGAVEANQYSYRKGNITESESEITLDSGDELLYNVNSSEEGQTLISLTSNVISEEDTILDNVGTIDVPLSSFTAASGTFTGGVISAGGTITTTVSIPRTGHYKIFFTTSVPTVSTYTAVIGDISHTREGAASTYHHISEPYSLVAGSHAFQFTSESAATISKITLKNVDFEVSPTGKTFINSRDYLEASDTWRLGASDQNSQWEFVGPDNEYIAYDCLYMSGGSTSHYQVNVATPGKYKVWLHGTAMGRVKLTNTISGEVYTSTTSGTSQYIDNIELQKGTNILCITAMQDQLLWNYMSVELTEAIASALTKPIDATISLDVNGVTVFKGKVNSTFNSILPIAFADFESSNKVDIKVLEGTVSFSKISFVKMNEDEMKSLVNEINSAKSTQIIKRLVEENIYFPTMKNHVGNVFLDFPIYAQLRNKNFNNINDVLSAFIKAADIEFSNPHVALYNGNKKITKLQDGHLRVVADTSMLKDGSTLVGAIYDDARMTYLDVKPTNGATTELNFGNVDVDNPTFKLMYFRELENVELYDGFSNIYKEIFVSPSGDDEIGTGELLSPYKTLGKAKSELESITSQYGDVVINLADGEYKLSETEIFTASHGGKSGYNVIIRGASNTVLSGGKKIENWTSEGNHIFSAPLTGVDYVRNLYVDNVPAIRARSEYVYKHSTDYTDAGGAKIGFKVAGQNFPITLTNIDDIELSWNDAWRNYRTSVKNIIRENGAIYITIDDGQLFPEIVQNMVFYLENAKELLDSPNEFYYNANEGKIYYYSIDGNAPQNTHIGDTELMIKVDGKPDNKVQNLIFENIKFRYGAYDFASRYGYKTTQSDSLGAIVGSNGEPMFAAQFTANHADGLLIKHCEFSCLGSAALDLNDDVTNSNITGTVIKDISGTGIKIGNPDHKYGENVCSNITVTDNVIRRAAGEYFANCGISIYYEQNIKVSNNTILDLPYTGISAGWGWENTHSAKCENIIISNNRIENVLQTLYDGGQIYTLGAIKGGIIRDNYLDTKGSDYWGGAIYLDAGSSHMDVYNNVMIDSYPWIEVQHKAYVTHSLNIYDNYAENTERNRNDATTVSCEEPTIITPDSPETVAIRNNAGTRISEMLENTELASNCPERISETPRFLYRTITPTHSLGTIEIEDFKEGGEGVGYHKAWRPKRNNNPYREDEISLIPLGDGYCWDTNGAGEWVKFDVRLDNTMATYSISVTAMALGASGDDVLVYVDDKYVAALDFTDTSNFQTITCNTGYLLKGTHTIKIELAQSSYVDKLSIIKN